METVYVFTIIYLKITKKMIPGSNNRYIYRFSHILRDNDLCPRTLCAINRTCAFTPITPDIYILIKEIYKTMHKISIKLYYLYNSVINIGDKAIGSST